MLSTVGSTSILMQSKSDRFPNGMGNDSGELGHNLMDHHFQVGASGTFKVLKIKSHTEENLLDFIYLDLEILEVLLIERIL